jgi:hypothetical protein
MSRLAGVGGLSVIPHLRGYGDAISFECGRNGQPSAAVDLWTSRPEIEKPTLAD